MKKYIESMVNCGVAVKWEDEPWWFNHDGAPVERAEDVYGRKAQFELVHPEKVIFVAEVGSNTSQKNMGTLVAKSSSLILIVLCEVNLLSRTVTSQSLDLLQPMGNQSSVQSYWHVRYSKWSM